MPPLKVGGGHLDLPLSVRPQLHKWGHPCPMDTFLVHINLPNIFYTKNDPR